MIPIAWGSLAYRITRRLALAMMRLFAFLRARPEDLEAVVIWGDKQLSRMHRLAPWLFRYSIPKGIGVTVYDLEFPSPLLISSYKLELDVLKTYLDMGAGSAIFKTIMKNKRAGNARPRMQDIKMEGVPSLVNAVGLPGPGIHGYLRSIEPFVKNADRPIGFSIGGDSVDDYFQVFQMIEKWMIQYSAKQYYYELNISCPNTAHGQMLSEQIPQLVGLLRTMRDYSSAVISVKCSPDQSNENLYQIAEQVSKIGRCIINLGNTRRVPIYDLDVDPDALTRPVAGLSGPLLLDRTIEMVKIVAPIGVPIIATGGISTIDDIRKLSDAGASLFAMATAVVKDMYVIPRLNKDIRGLSADR